MTGLTRAGPMKGISRVISKVHIKVVWPMAIVIIGNIRDHLGSTIIDIEVSTNIQQRETGWLRMTSHRIRVHEGEPGLEIRPREAYTGLGGASHRRLDMLGPTRLNEGSHRGLLVRLVRLQVRRLEIWSHRGLLSNVMLGHRGLLMEIRSHRGLKSNVMLGHKGLMRRLDVRRHRWLM